MTQDDKKRRKKAKFCNKTYEVSPGIKKLCGNRLTIVKATSWRKGQRFCIDCNERAMNGK